MDLTALIDLTRRLAGDPAYEGNSLAWEDGEIVEALNWAQTMYAETTHCTYREVPAAAPTGADGVFTIPPGFILVDRVMIPDQVFTAPNATITAPSSTPNNTSVAASVPAQPGASFFWTVAGGEITAGQGTNAVSFTGLAVPGSTATVACIVTRDGSMDSQAVDVALT